MLFKGLLILILFSACQSGLIPCPTVKGTKYKKSSARQAYYAPRMASAKQTVSMHEKYPRPAPKSPVLKHVNVEEWDCPKPGSKRVLPKAVKDNIRKNRKAYAEHYRYRSAPPDSLQAFR